MAYVNLLIRTKTRAEKSFEVQPVRERERKIVKIHKTIMIFLMSYSYSRMRL